MKDSSEKEKFIQLRAKGFSFDKIAQQIEAFPNGVLTIERSERFPLI